jgi:Ca-activated chloride channel family protein
MSRFLKMLGMCLAMCNISFAFSPADVWYTRDQQGAHAFAKGDMPKAAQLFEEPHWRSSAQYKAKNYEAALSGFQDARSSDNYYNQGNALAHLQRYEEAIKAYDKALTLDASNHDAEYNREIVKKLLEQQKKDNKKDQNKQKQDQPKQNQDSKNNAGKGQSGQNDKSADQKQKDEQKNNADQKENPGQADQKKEPGTAQPKQGDKQDEQEMPAQAKPSPVDKKTAQWLNQVPDDPGGLLRQKFLRDHLRQTNGESER